MLQVVIQIDDAPDTGAPVPLSVAAGFVDASGDVIPAKDAAPILAALELARQAVLASVTFKPPSTIVRPVLGVAPRNGLPPR